MRKKISVLVVILSIVAVILSWMGIGVYSSGSAVRDMNETQKLMLVKEDIDKSSMKEKVWLEQDIIDMFYSMTNGEAELEYLDCTLMPDRACERIGAVLYKNTEEGVIEVAFFDERGYVENILEGKTKILLDLHEKGKQKRGKIRPDFYVID